MPKIAQYDAPDGLGLRPSETGIAAMAGAARRLQGDFSEAAQAQEATGKRFGQDVQVAGDVATKYIDHQQISAGATALAREINAKTKQWDDIAKRADPNDPTVATTFLKNLEPDLEKFKEGFLTEAGQKWAESHVDAFRQHMFHKTSADMATLAGQAAIVNQRQTVNSLSNTVRGDPASMDFALNMLESTIAAKVDSSPNLTGAVAGKLRAELLQKGKEEIIKSAAMGAIEKTGEVPAWVTSPKYSPYINGTELKQFAQAARYYERLGRSEDRAARVQRDYEAKNDFNQQINALEAATIPEKVGDPPTLPPDYWDKLRALSRHPGAALEPGRLKTMVDNGERVTARLNKPEPLGPVSHETTMDLLQRMRLPAGDPRRLETNDEIYKAYGDGKLNNGDFNFLNREFTTARTPEGERLNQVKTNFFHGVKAQITKSNPLMGRLDQDGDFNLYRLEWDVNQKIAEYRKAGKNPYDLFDPSKPDFMGWPEAIKPYQKPLDQSIKDMARRLGAGRTSTTPGESTPPIVPAAQPPARKPGESLSDYEMRKARK